jgi:hypothetical protein
VQRECAIGATVGVDEAGEALALGVVEKRLGAIEHALACRNRQWRDAHLRIIAVVEGRRDLVRIQRLRHVFENRDKAVADTRRKDLWIEPLVQSEAEVLLIQLNLTGALLDDTAGQLPAPWRVD